MTHPLRLAYRELSEQIDATFFEHINAGKRYQLDNTDLEHIEKLTD